MADSLQSAIEVRALTKRFGRVTALDSVDLSVAPGSVFGLIGPNGAGKTTLMRILLDIVRPTSGSVSVLGSSPHDGGADLRRRVGYLPGELRLESRVTGAALLSHYAEISGGVAPASIELLAERLGIDLGRQVRTLSKGNKQKLGLIQAFVHRPDVLILDEPTSGLDPLNQQVFLELVGEARQAGQTVFLSSHVLSEIQQAADSVGILRSGRVVSVSSVEELKRTALRKVTAQFVGASADEISAALGSRPTLTDVVVTVQDSFVSLTATLISDIDGFVKAISRFSVAELSIEEPDLEQHVLGLYGASDAR